MTNKCRVILENTRPEINEAAINATGKLILTKSKEVYDNYNLNIGTDSYK